MTITRSFDFKEDIFRAIAGSKDKYLRKMVELLAVQMNWDGENSKIIMEIDQPETEDAQIADEMQKYVIDGKFRDAQQAWFTLKKIYERKGGSIDMTDIVLAVQNVRNGTESNLIEAYGVKIKELKDSKGWLYIKGMAQYQLFKSIQDNTATFAIGPAGTGKTLIAVGTAAKILADGDSEIDKIIITRPAVENGASLGYLPGEIKDKMDPYLRPIYDALGKFYSKLEIESFIERGTVEIVPLNYMRGYTLDNSFVILDEAQNTTKSQMHMLLTRIGQNSKLVVTGDLDQSDLGDHNGLQFAKDFLRPQPGYVDFVTLKDVFRSEFVAKVENDYKKYMKQKDKS